MANYYEISVEQASLLTHLAALTLKKRPGKYPVTNVELEDGTKLVFDKPLYHIEKSSQK